MPFLERNDQSKRSWQRGGFSCALNRFCHTRVHDHGSGGAYPFLLHLSLRIEAKSRLLITPESIVDRRTQSAANRPRTVAMHALAISGHHYRLSLPRCTISLDHIETDLPAECKLSAQVHALELATSNARVWPTKRYDALQLPFGTWSAPYANFWRILCDTLAHHGPN